ncbi:MAG: hypothetical protein HYV42_02160 [Candidatus Magasanikbacteria bacterium]|nr:hypothetical protein [Candidatus Magasanikbacteria bacterium]
MTLRARIFILISLVILVILGISLFFLVRRRAAPSVTTGGEAPGEAPAPAGGAATVPGGAAPAGSVTPVAAPARQLTPEEVEQQAARQAARIFIERFYTYSSAGNFQNIREVEALVTPALWEKLQRQIKPGAAPAGFSALETQVVVVELTRWEPPAAEVELSVAETREQQGIIKRGQRRYQATLTKSSGVWQVASFRAL